MTREIKMEIRMHHENERRRFSRDMIALREFNSNEQRTHCLFIPDAVYRSQICALVFLSGDIRSDLNRSMNDREISCSFVYFIKSRFNIFRFRQEIDLS